MDLSAWGGNSGFAALNCAAMAHGENKSLYHSEKAYLKLQKLSAMPMVPVEHHAMQQIPEVR